MVAVVVGASSDIGRAVAADLAGLGHAVQCWGRDAARLARTVEACDAATPGASAVRVDVTDVTSLDAAAAPLAGRDDLHAVVWAAGTFDHGRADAVDPARWLDVLATNLVGATGLVARLAPVLVTSAPSALVLIGSGAAHTAYPDNAAYVAAKHGLAGLAAATFLDLRDSGVKVSLVSPGLVAAGAGLRSPAGRSRPGDLLAPEDVARAVRFVVTFPGRGCPTEVRLQPQRDPDRPLP